MKISSDSIIDTLFDQVDTESCNGCQFAEYVTDPYCTGDSPAITECNGSAEECPAVKSKVISLIEELETAMEIKK